MAAIRLYRWGADMWNGFWTVDVNGYYPRVLMIPLRMLERACLVLPAGRHQTKRYMQVMDE